MFDMKQSFALAFSLAVLVAIPAAQAQELEYYGVEAIISEDFSIHNTVVLDFTEPVGTFDYEPGFFIDSLNYSANFDYSECELSNTNSGSRVSCIFIGMDEDHTELTLEFNTRNAIKRIGENYRYTVDYSVPVAVQSSFIMFKLPQNNIFAGDDNQSFFPSDGQTLTDGKRIMVFWEDENITANEQQQYSILFSSPGAPDNMTGMLFATVPAFGIIIVAIAALFFWRGRGSKVAVVKSVLNQDEKKVIDVLNAHSGKTGQKVIVRETDFSKAKVSRIVKNLRDRSVVEIEPISGRENRVMLRLGQVKPPPVPDASQI